MGIYKKYFGRYKAPFLTAVFAVMMEAGCDLLGPTIMSKIINEGIERSSMTGVLYWGRWMLVVTAVGAVFAVTRNILASRVSRRLGADLRFDMFKKLMRFSEPSSDRLESGSLITRVTNDAQQVTQFVNGLMRVFFKAPANCIGSIILATVLNPKLSIIVYALVVFVALCIILSMKLSYPRYGILQRSIDRVNSVVQEYLLGVRLVKAFGTYPEEERKFDSANEGLMRANVRAEIIITFISPIMTLSVGLATALVVLAGSSLFSVGKADVGDISAFTIYMAQILTSLLTITNIFNTFVRTKASNARILELLSADEDFAPGDSAKRELSSGSVAFEHVSFAYPEGSGENALSDISFTTPSGGSLAVIGPTGSGKSTLAWLLMRFYDPDSGSVRLGGEDIRSLDPSFARRSVALVSQKPMLFSGTVRDNLLWGDRDATDDELRAALTRAEAGFVFDMPGGLDARIGSGGVNISGGQKQRLSIARALLKRAPVMLLDDATSALDAVTEAKVRHELMKKGSATLIMITQRCTTAMRAEHILVLDGGRCVGYGTHDELMATSPTYRALYSSQVEPEAEGKYGG